AHDLSMRRSTHIPSVLVSQPYYNPHNMYDNMTQQCPQQPQENGNKMTSSLEFVLNMKLENLPTTSVLPRLWPIANTCTYQCYNTPLCSSISSTITSDMATTTSRPMPDYSVSEMYKTEMEQESPILADDPWWCSDTYLNHSQSQTGYPNFRHNNELSYPLIYKYVASTEDE
ncbi:hypothetical protein L9F63_007800, partial [Diploptera punctata]